MLETTRLPGVDETALLKQIDRTGSDAWDGWVGLDMAVCPGVVGPAGALWAVGMRQMKQGGGPLTA